MRIGNHQLKNHFVHICDKTVVDIFDTVLQNILVSKLKRRGFDCVKV